MAIGTSCESQSWVVPRYGGSDQIALRCVSGPVGSAQLGPARPGPARPGPARPGSARLGSARLGSARPAVRPQAGSVSAAHGFG
ncbi:hypothetical protein D7S86_02245 [Pararobbsia silviterrae]|uniref:Uncharacterized protein n=1 Tax=Pararobbsia silviterrae TaxID=1792498 RepID=A0A494Y800_9BURK|nr:hypothetical protein D7S86_02245 [Pararobbsia silviterrae]